MLTFNQIFKAEKPFSPKTQNFSHSETKLRENDLNKQPL